MLEGRAGDGVADRGIDSGSTAASASPPCACGSARRGRLRAGRSPRARRGSSPGRWCARWLPAAKLSATRPTRLATTWLPPAWRRRNRAGRPGAPRRRRGGSRRRRSVAVETTKAPPSSQVARTLVIVATTSIAASVRPDGSNRVMSPVRRECRPAGRPSGDVDAAGRRCRLRGCSRTRGGEEVRKRTSAKLSRRAILPYGGRGGSIDARHRKRLGCLQAIAYMAGDGRPLPPTFTS